MKLHQSEVSLLLGTSFQEINVILKIKLLIFKNEGILTRSGSRIYNNSWYHLLPTNMDLALRILENILASLIIAKKLQFNIERLPKP